ncbi:hypothetical protein [Sporosarcina sp. FSL K6-1508]|uniref:hypothetical protein n=1 Tax=Sporosarcina sp. FSL K6-1508 TaxID=2921553 RepID=UPI0030F947B3
MVDTCKVCGCTDENACVTSDGPCWWADSLERNLCSSCADRSPVVDETIQYDNHGRMKFHPAYHFNHGNEYTTKELAYICQHYRLGNVRNLSMAVGRTEGTLRSLVNQLRKDGEFELYKNMNF